MLSGLPVVVTDNVVPRIGVLEPEPARRAIREMFLAHVIGGKHLSRRADFTAMVRGATPDLVLTGVEVLAAETGGNGVVVVDIGGATTDVHSVVRLDPEDAGLSREVVASTPVTRTVEGDLGMRWSALSTWEAGREAGLARRGPPRRSRTPERRSGVPARRRRRSEARTRRSPRPPPRSPCDATSAAPGSWWDPTGGSWSAPARTSARSTSSSGSGGVLRHATPAGGAPGARRGSPGVSPEGWQQPEHPRVVVDRDYVLAAVGLLSESRPAAAAALARSLSTCDEIPAS